jgi:hypothetical protein
MLVASNNFVNRQYAEKMKGWIGMTKIGQLIQEDIDAAANAAAERERRAAEAKLAEERRATQERMAALKFMLEADMPKEKVLQFMQRELVGAEAAQ